MADALNRLSSVGGVAINHDAAGRVTADGVTTYGYDEASRLVSVTPVGGGAAGQSSDVLARVAMAGQAAMIQTYDRFLQLGQSTPGACSIDLPFPSGQFRP